MGTSQLKTVGVLKKHYVEKQVWSQWGRHAKNKKKIVDGVGGLQAPISVPNLG